MPISSRRNRSQVIITTVLTGAIVASATAAPPPVNAWLGDAGHFLIRARVLANNPSGESFTVTVQRHFWPQSGAGPKQPAIAIRIRNPRGAMQATGTIAEGHVSATIEVPPGPPGIYEIESERGGYGMHWITTSLSQIVADGGDLEKHPRGLFELHAMAPRRWYFFVPEGTRRFRLQHVVLTSQTHREDYGLLVISPRGQRVDALYGGKPLDMSPTSGTRAGFPRRLERYTVTREIDVDAGADGAFWSLWVTGGDSHNFSDLTLTLEGVPPYFATAPEHWFDPVTGLGPPRKRYDTSVIRAPDTIGPDGTRRPPYPRYFGAPTPFLGDEDYNGWRGPHTLWLFNPENRPIEIGAQTYLATDADLATPVRLEITGPAGTALTQVHHLALDEHVAIPRAGGGVYRIDIDGRRWFPWTYPTMPIVSQGRPNGEGAARFALETGIARQWYFRVPVDCRQFKVTVDVHEPDHVLRVEVHAPDRMIEDRSVRGGVPQTLSVPVTPALAGRVWFLRTEVGSATRFVSEPAAPRQANIEADITLAGVPGYLAPSWEQVFDPAHPETHAPAPHPLSGRPVVWRPLPPLPVPRHDLQLMATADSLIAISGAHDRTVADVHRFDRARQIWIAAAPIPRPRGWFGAAIIDDHIYCAGGKRIREVSDAPDDDRRPHTLDSLDIYDPATDRWREGPGMRGARAGCAAAALRGELYVIGGSSRTEGFLDRVEIFNPATGAWRDGPPLPDPREDMGVAVVDEKLYVMGGVRHPLRADVFILDPDTGKWSHGTPMPAPRRSFAVAVTPPLIWCIGGVGDTGFLTDVLIYDTGSDTWRHGPALPRAMAWMGAAAVDNTVYLAGGADFNHAGEHFNWLADVYSLSP